MKKHDQIPNDFIARWSSDIAKGGFAGIPGCLMTCQSRMGITSVELNVLAQLITIRYTAKNPYASMKLLAGRMGKSEKSVRAAVRSLEHKGLITRIYVNGSPNTFNFAPLVHSLENHSCMNPARKRSPYYTKTTDPPRTITSAKEEVANKKTIKRKGDVISIGEIMAKQLKQSMPNSEQ